MTVGFKRAAFGLGLSVVSIGAIMAAFWLLSRALDTVFGLQPILGSPAAEILAAASLLIGVFWVSWAYSFLLFVGKGLPLELFGRAIHPTRVLVTIGPYAYTRNPVVLGMLFLLLGVAFLRGSITGLVLLPIFAIVTIVYLAEFEEKGLEQRFGEDYEEYRRRVPRLFPRLSAYIHEPVAES